MKQGTRFPGSLFQHGRSLSTLSVHCVIHGDSQRLGLAFSNAVRNEIHSPNQRVWREKPVKGKAVLGTESRECFHESFVLGGEEPSMVEHSLTSGCWPRGEGR